MRIKGGIMLDDSIQQTVSFECCLEIVQDPLNKQQRGRRMVPNG